MSVYGGPQVVTSGLILDLDANNTKSYVYQENLAQYSQDWTTFVQSVANVSVTAASSISPDGTLTGQTFTTTSSAIVNDGFIQKIWTSTFPIANNVFTFSQHVKQGTSPSITLCLAPYNGSQYKQVFAKLTWSTLSVSVYGGTGSINLGGVVPVSNGWYRLWVTTSNDYGATSVSYRIYNRDDLTNNLSGETNYVWGSQLELGNTPNLYIVTTTTPIIPSNNWIDLSTFKNNGTLANTPSFNNNSLVFSGYGRANNYVSLSNLPTTLPQLTVEVWVNLTPTNNQAIGYIIGQRNNVFRLMYTNSNFQWVCATTNNGWYSAGTTATTPNLTVYNVWNHVVAVYDGTNNKIYVNGVLQITSTGTVSGNVSMGSLAGLYIMQTDSSNLDNASGQLGMARIYSTALSQEQIVSNFNAMRGRYGL